ncbi:MAG: S9 family peptidase [Candidatus Eisenbacteria bacterium]|uniref:S9 family peptidase n=1 Tax=Eiseniibacteriota bacterium TaxID=2212470 RepID=A0A948S0A6_UNCEI|nr:S9 family peptidase [Candidatus Eisenbacteria bacterium]MBU2693226.1 S9 family peptidase [Candidatus Eisenbacteria bacterium]
MIQGTHEERRTFWQARRPGELCIPHFHRPHDLIALFFAPIFLLLVLVVPMKGGALPPPGIPDPEGLTNPSLLTPYHLICMDRVGSPSVDLGGTRVLYPVTRYHPEESARKTQIWLLDLETGTTRQMTFGSSATSPCWSSEGDTFYFLRDSQVWRLSLQGGEAEPVTSIPGGIDGFLLNPSTDHPQRWSIAFSRRVDPLCPPCDWGCSHESVTKWEARPGLVSEQFPLRHWSSWRDSLRSHVFIGDPTTDHWTDLTPGFPDCPPIALAEGLSYSVSPDGEWMVVIRNMDGHEALSTNNDLFLLNLRKAERLARRRQSTWDAADLLTRGLSEGGGNDDHPTFSPGGRWVAYTSMARPGYESDLRRIVLHDLESGEDQCLSCDLDRSAGGLTWSLDGRYLYFTAYDKEAAALYRIRVKDGRLERLLRAGSISDLAPLPDGRLLLTLSSSRMPSEVFLCDPEKLKENPERWEDDLAVCVDGRYGSPFPEMAPIKTTSLLQQITFHNYDKLQYLEMTPPEHFHFKGALSDTIHGFIVMPPDASLRQPGAIPLVLVFHGGPQWAYHDFWLGSYNFQMIAAQGYAVATINFHGSAGFGIDFQDAIRGHWGDIPGQDIRLGLDYILEHYGNIDPYRIAAIGRSYGGYIVNWLNGQTDRFSCFVSHSGSFDETAGWGTTDELWFPEWEFSGPPWVQPETYRANSSSSFAHRMRTPTLIIHGQRDYRVDLSDGLQTYSTLKRQGIDARFLTFPDEGHHILHPKSWLLMWDEIFGWLDRYLR